MNPSGVRIAVVEDDAQVRSVVESMLRSAGHTFESFASGNEFLESGGVRRFGTVLTDLQMEGASGLDVLKACRSESLSPEVLVITGFGSIGSAVEAMREGAFDYLPKPVDPRELLRRVSQAIEAWRLKLEVEALSAEDRLRHGLAPLIGESDAIRACLLRAAGIAESSTTALILGERGTGKELIARYIHSCSPRADRTFRTLHCAAIRDQQLESELVGHARHAASGSPAKRGVFEEVDGGTLFLDEIGSIRSRAQARLAAVLEEGAVRRVGDRRRIPLNVRLLCASSQNVAEAAESGRFRGDLFRRLSVSILEVPPLRDRPEDIEPLARHFLEESMRRLGKLRVFSREALDFLRDYAFPGNARELRFIVDQAVLLSEDGIIRTRDFGFSRRGGTESMWNPAGRRAPVRRRRIADEITPRLLAENLRQHSGDRVRTARALNISRSTLNRLLARDKRDPAERDLPTDPIG